MKATGWQAHSAATTSSVGQPNGVVSCGGAGILTPFNTWQDSFASDKGSLTCEFTSARTWCLPAARAYSRMMSSGACMFSRRSLAHIARTYSVEAQHLVSPPFNAAGSRSWEQSSLSDLVPRYSADWGADPPLPSSIWSGGILRSSILGTRLFNSPRYRAPAKPPSA